MRTVLASSLAIPILAAALSMLSAQARPELVVSVGHSSPPRDVAFAGGYLATGDGSTVALIDLSTGLTVAHLPQAGYVATVEASPVEDLIAVGTCSRSAELWNLRTRRPVRRLAIERECVDSVAFSPDGALLATTEVGCCACEKECATRRSVKIWDVRSGALKKELAIGSESYRVVFGRHGRWLAAADGDGKTTVFEWPSGRTLQTFGGEPDAGPPAAGDSSPDGKYLLWRQYRGFQVWNVTSGTPIAVPAPASASTDEPDKPSQVSAAEFLNDGRLAYVDGDRLRIVTLPNGPLEDLPLEKTRVESIGHMEIEKRPDWLRIHRSGRTIAGMNDSRTVLWNVGEGKLREVTSPMLPDAETLQWGPSGAIAWKERYSGVWAWSGSAGQPLELETDDDGDDALSRAVSKRVENDVNVTHSAFSPDKHWVAASRQTDHGAAVDVWPAKAGDGVRLDTSDRTHGPQPPAFSGDSRWLATFVTGKSVKVWSAGSWKLERTWTLPGTGEALAFASRGSRLAIATVGETAIWDARTARKLMTLTGPGTSRVTEVAWSPDDHRLVTQSDDGVLRFWSVSNGRLLASLYAIGDTRDWLLVTPDGRFDGSERALATVVAWRTGDRVSFDKRLTERHRVRDLWRQLLKTAG